MLFGDQLLGVSVEVKVQSNHEHQSRRSEFRERENSLLSRFLVGHLDGEALRRRTQRHDMVSEVFAVGFGVQVVQGRRRGKCPRRQKRQEVVQSSKCAKPFELISALAELQGQTAIELLFRGRRTLTKCIFVVEDDRLDSTLTRGRVVR